MSKITTMRLRRMTGFPDSVYVKFKSNEVLNVEGNMSDAFSFPIAFNTLHNPWRDGASNQPNGYDQWSQMYNRFQVRGAKLIIRLVRVGATIFKGLVYPSANGTALTTATDISTQPYVRSQWLNGQVNYNRPPMVIFITSKKVIARNIYDEDFSAVINADPTRLLWFHYYMESATGADVNNFTIDFTLIQYARMFDRKNLISS